jgi:hypothetical protein
MADPVVVVEEKQAVRVSCSTSKCGRRAGVFVRLPDNVEIFTVQGETPTSALAIGDGE